MAQCAKCKNEITDIAVASGKCPICGARIKAFKGTIQPPQSSIKASPTSGSAADAPAPKSSGSAASTAPPIESAQGPSAGSGPAPLEAAAAPRGAPGDDSVIAASRAYPEIHKSVDSRKMTPQEMAELQRTVQMAIEQGGGELFLGSQLSPATEPVSAKAQARSQGKLPEIGPETRLVIQTRGFSSRSEPRPGVKPQERLDYELLRLIGEGGMGVVYKARQTSVDREVAIKMIRSEKAHDKLAREHFLSEAVVIGELDHPNIIPIHDVGKDHSNALFYSMKCVTGTPWSEVIAQKTLQQNIQILMSVSDAVAFAHSRGVVHRDLKPENVMLGAYGEVLVMDWGLAIVLPDAPKAESVSRSSGLGYTPSYAAPELVTGPTTKIGIWSDVYLLGAILYEIVTGNPPHMGRSASECSAAAIRNLIHPTTKTGELVDIALVAMASKSADRFRSVQEFQEAVRAYLSHSESLVLSARAAEDLKQARKSDDYQVYARSVFAYQEALELWDGNKAARTGLSEAQLAYADAALRKENYELGLEVLDPKNTAHAPLVTRLESGRRERDNRRRNLKRTRQTLAALAGVFFVVVAGAAYYSNQKRLEAEEAAIAESKAREAADAAAVAAKQSAEQERLAKLKAVEQEGIAKEQEKFAKEQEKIAKDQKVIADENAAKAREQEMIARTNAEEAKRNAEQAQLNEAEAKRQTKIAQEANAAQVYEAAVARIGLAAEQVNANAFDSGRDALQLVPDTQRGWEWWRLDYLARQGQAGSATLDFEVDAVAVDSTGGRYAAAGRSLDGEIRIGSLADLRDGKQTTVRLGYPVLSLAFSPDDRYLAAAGQGNAILVWDLTEPAGRVEKFVAESADKPVASISRVKFAAARDKDERDDVTGKIKQGKSSRWLTAACSDGKARIWDVTGGIDGSQRPRSVLAGDILPLRDVAMSPGGGKNGILVVTAGDLGHARVWSFDPQREFVARTDELSRPRVSRIHRGPIYSVLFSPDGRLVASAGADGRIIIWDPLQAPGEDTKGLTTAGNVPLELQNVPPGTIVYDEFAHAEPVHVLAALPDEESFVSAADDNTLRIWPWPWNKKKEGAKPLKVLRGHGGWVRSATYARLPASGDWLVVSGGHDRQVRTWNVSGYAETLPLASRLARTNRDGEQAKAEPIGHADAVLSAKFSRAPGAGSGDYHVVTASRDHTARVWHIRPGAADGRLTALGLSEGHDFSVASVVYFPDGKRVATSGVDGQVCVWDVDTGVQLARLPATGISAAVAVSSDGQWLLTGSDDTNVHRWNVADATARFIAGKDAVPDNISINHPDEQYSVRVVAFVPGRNDRFYVGCASGAGYLWGISGTTAESVRLDDGHTTTVNAAAFVTAGAGVRLVTAADESVVRTFDPAGGGPKETLDHAVIPGVSIGSVVALGALNSGEVLTVVAPPKQPGRYVLCKWNVARRELTARQELSDAEIVSGLAVSPKSDDALLAVGTGDSTMLQRWKIEPLQAVKSSGNHLLGNELLKSARAKVWAVAYAPDGSRFATAGGNEAHVWPAAGGAPTMRLGPHRAVASAGFSSDGKYVVTGSWDESFKIWAVSDSVARSVRRIAVRGERAINSAVFTPAPNSYRILTAHDGARDKGLVCLWEWDPQQPGADLTPIRKLVHPKKVNSAIFSPDGKQALTACADGKTRLWDLVGNTDQPRLTLEAPLMTGEILSAAFTSDGKWVAAGGEDKLVVVWNAETGARLLDQPLTGHSAAITSVAFLDKGERLLTGSRDNTAKVWDPQIIRQQAIPQPAVAQVEKEGGGGADPAGDAAPPAAAEKLRGKELLTLRGHTSEVTSVEFSPDGRYVLTGSLDNTAILWLTDKPTQ